VPFVLIQIVMVGLIIAFPGIVSSGLDKKEVYDMEKVQREMEANMPAPELMPPMEPDASASEPETGASAPASAAEDDPMKALQESMAAPKK